MNPIYIPAWLSVFDDGDLLFLKRFLLASGSLKELAAAYGVSYPTIRTRLDRIIAKVQAVEAPVAGDSFEQLLDTLVEQGVMTAGTARTLKHSHNRVIRDVSERANRTVASESGEGDWYG
ncbi:MAG TPA: DUF2089 family protein [Candidatus Hydrogenedentes bacterium]|nr:DUF2089 family protein [Candidatus Hydrogenedentota bacterium]